MLSSSARSLTFAVAVTYAALGLLLFLAPHWAAPNFAWKVSPLVAMTIGGWCLGNAWAAYVVASRWRFSLVVSGLVYLALFGLFQSGVVIAFWPVLKLGHWLAWLYLAALAPKWPEAERVSLVESTLAVLDHPDFAPVFAAGSRAEVEISGRIGEATLSGRIDRLMVADDRVLIVDYKTNRPAPNLVADAPHDYVMQLALYRAVLRRLYPSRPVEAAILWTDRPALMEIPSVLLDLAEMQAAATPSAMQPSPAPRDGLPP